jgi:ABC-2 type transport system ATP-binding protein
MGFIGENGAGKTTTIKTMLGIAKKTGGSVKLFGLDFADHEKEIKSRIGVVFDECSFHDTLTAADVAKILGRIYPAWDDPLYLRYLRQFGLPEKKKIKEYSRGMKMKLSIAAALSHHPDLLILDEPTSGLDPVVREEILDIFLEFIQDEEHAILLSSHITSDLDKIADYLTFIHEGKIVLSKSKDELLEDLGILKCSREEFDALDKKSFLTCRTNQFGCEVLIKDKKEFIVRHPEMIVDPVSTESVMLMYARGTAV